MHSKKKNKKATNKEKASNYSIIDKDTNTDSAEKDQSQNNAPDGNTKWCAIDKGSDIMPKTSNVYKGWT